MYSLWEKWRGNLLFRRHLLYVERNTEACSSNHCCCGKAISNTYSECVFVALGIQHAKRMRRVTLFSVDCTTLPYFCGLYDSIIFLCTVRLYHISVYCTTLPYFCVLYDSTIFLCTVRLYHISPHYLIKGTIFKKILDMKCVF
jgi:hypothetical protein